MKDTLDQLLRLTDEMGELMRREAVASGTTCSASCPSHCCYQLFTISFVEGITTAWWLISQRRDTVDFRQKIRDSIPPMLDSKTGGWMSPDDFFQKQHPCAFLDEKRKRCSIYPGRPLTCRAYFVRTDPDLCIGTYEENTGVRVLDVSHWKEQASAIARIAEGELKLTGELSGLCGPVPVMVLLGLVFLEAGPDAVRPYLLRKS